MIEEHKADVKVRIIRTEKSLKKYTNHKKIKEITPEIDRIFKRLCHDHFKGTQPISKSPIIPKGQIERAKKDEPKETSLKNKGIKMVSNNVKKIPHHIIKQAISKKVNLCCVSDIGLFRMIKNKAGKIVRINTMLENKTKSKFCAKLWTEFKTPERIKNDPKRVMGQEKAK